MVGAAGTTAGAGDATSTGAALAVCPVVATSIICVPCETLSPTFT